MSLINWDLSDKHCDHIRYIINKHLNSCDSHARSFDSILLLTDVALLKPVKYIRDFIEAHNCFVPFIRNWVRRAFITLYIYCSIQFQLSVVAMKPPLELILADRSFRKLEQNSEPMLSKLP